MDYFLKQKQNQIEKQFWTLKTKQFWQSLSAYQHIRQSAPNKPPSTKPSTHLDRRAYQPSPLQTSMMKDSKEIIIANSKRKLSDRAGEEANELW